MTSSSPRSQQHATRAAFFIPGFAAAVWAPLVPFAKTRAGLDDAALGLVLLCLGTGSLLAMPLAGALTARQGCRRVMLATTALIVAMLPLLAWMPTPLSLGLVLFGFGAGIGAMDCVMNMQAVAVERDSGRAMMSGFHAFYSIGGLAGAAMTTLLLALGAAPWLAAVVAVVAIVLLALGFAGHWRSERVAQDAPLLAWPRGVVLFIGVLGFVVFLAEGAVMDWSAVFLIEARAMAPARAGAGFVVFTLVMTVTRLWGDGLVERLGRQRAIGLGAALACVGFLLAVLVPAWWVALLGYAMVGLGCANIVPALFSLTGQQKVMPESVAIPAVTTLGYAGVLAGPALIGFVAHGSSIGTALACVAIALAGVALSTRSLMRNLR